MGGEGDRIALRYDPTQKKKAARKERFASQTQPMVAFCFFWTIFLQSSGTIRVDFKTSTP